MQTDLYEDGPEVNEVKPLVDYILSMGFLFDPAQNSKRVENAAHLLHLVAEEMRLHGSIHITKNAGVYIAR